ncbi:MAG TPA: hypothetical protein VLN58_12740, partial [Verrucomicrobiae bacterium]|nr:hypothetical protein [Verrucomicrobiae bacterium]
KKKTAGAFRTGGGSRALRASQLTSHIRLVPAFVETTTGKAEQLRQESSLVKQARLVHISRLVRSCRHLYFFNRAWHSYGADK